MKQRNSLILVALLATVLFVPWLGDVYFYSKGEPREAIVAVSMLEQGNWILPVSYGADIPYKPPLLAWLIALCSVVFNGGVVNEFTSRLPSAIAAIALLVAGWRIVATHSGERKAWIATLVMATSFEVFRASEACRVDMVLTACMVGAVYALYSMRGHPWRVVWAVLLLSGATLTKGPVGSLLPCLAIGIYWLLCGRNFFKAFFTLAAICLASFVLPALWYWAAYQQGGPQFAELAWEENIGRLTGTMSYDSHVNPWYFNIYTILAGMLPWTVPVLIALCYRSVRTRIRSLRLDRSLPMMAWTVGLTVLVFYCIPESKRSVYLLPCYPFIAYGCAWVLVQVSATKLIRVWSGVLAVIGLVAPCLFIAAAAGCVPGLTLAPLHWWLWPFAVMPLLMSLWWLFTRRVGGTGLKSALIFTYALYLAYNAAYMPMVLNARSDVHAARAVEQRLDPADAVVTYIPDSLSRYYTMNFYLGDRLRRVENPTEVPDSAWLITAPEYCDGAHAGDTIARRSCDTRRATVLVAPSILKHQKNTLRK